VRRAVLGLALSIAIFGGCGSPAWPKTAGETTCTEWTDQMTPAQRDALGTAILLALRADDGGTLAPRDPVIKAYVKAIGDTCKENPDVKVSAVAATLYNLSRDLQP
jgi:hypothetical protein